MRNLSFVRAYEEPESAAARFVASTGSPRAWCASGYKEQLHDEEGYSSDVITLYMENYNPGAMMMYFLNATVTNFASTDEIMSFSVGPNYNGGIGVAGSLWLANESATFHHSCLIDATPQLQILAASNAYVTSGSLADVRFEVSLQVVEVSGQSSACCVPGS